MNDAFKYFINSCIKFLDFLVQDYSFLKTKPKFTPPECSIEYRKDNIIFDVLYEYGDFPWIRVTINGKDDSLDRIVKKNWPVYTIKRKKNIKDPNEKIDTVLQQYSNVLLEYITSITT